MRADQVRPPRQPEVRTPSPRDCCCVEYERSSELCSHVDDVRNVITSFFLTIVAGMAVAVSRYAEGSLPGSRVGTPEQVVSAVSAGVAVLGALFVMTLARLRRVQLERYQLMNGILDAALDPRVRHLVPFDQSSVALPGRRKALRVRSTGSYLWTLVIILPTAAVSVVTTLVALSPQQVSTAVRTGGAAVVAVVVVVALDRIYQALSTPPQADVVAPMAIDGASEPRSQGDHL